MTRRRFLYYSGGLGAGLVIPCTHVARAYAGIGSTLEKYVQPVALPGSGIVVATPRSANQYAFTQTQINRRLHPNLPPTPLWAYDDGSGLDGQAGSFGMAVVVQTGTPIQASFTNALPEKYPTWIPVDTRLTPLAPRCG